MMKDPNPDKGGTFFPRIGGSLLQGKSDFADIARPDFSTVAQIYQGARLRVCKETGGCFSLEVLVALRDTDIVIRERNRNLPRVNTGSECVRQCRVRQQFRSCVIPIQSQRRRPLLLGKSFRKRNNKRRYKSVFVEASFDFE
jgi:hypothetical protein